MAEKLDPPTPRLWRTSPKEMVSIEELLMSEVITTESLIALLVKKGIITEEELLEEIKRVNRDRVKAEK